MPKLLRPNGELAPPPELLDAGQWTPESGLGVKLPADAEVDERWLAAPLIGIDFPAFNDGRGLSLAVLLRTRHGYAGELVAVGAVHEDLLHYMRRCGFSGFVLNKEEAPPAATLHPHSDYYQASAAEPRPACRRMEARPSISSRTSPTPSS